MSPLGHSHLFKVHLVPPGFTSSSFIMGTKFPPEIPPPPGTFKPWQIYNRSRNPSRRQTRVCQRGAERLKGCGRVQGVYSHCHGGWQGSRGVLRDVTTRPLLLLCFQLRTGSPGLGRSLSRSRTHWPCSYRDLSFMSCVKPWELWCTVIIPGPRRLKQAS